jgi:hypothetical protein
MENSTVPCGRMAAAAVAILVLALIGILLLGFFLEVLRADVRELRQAVLERPQGAPAVAADIKALREAVDGLSAKIDAIHIPDSSKSADRLSVEVKNLANRVEAMTNAAHRPAKAGSGGKTTRKAAPQPQDNEDASRPYYGPVYPVYPGY